MKRVKDLPSAIRLCHNPEKGHFVIPSLCSGRRLNPSLYVILNPSSPVILNEVKNLMFLAQDKLREESNEIDMLRIRDSSPPLLSCESKKWGLRMTL